MDKTFAIKLKQARALTGLSQQGMADQMLISKRNIEKWETGERVPPEYVQRFLLNELENILIKSPSLQRLQDDLSDCRAEVKAFRAEAKNILDHTPRDTAQGLAQYQKFESKYTLLNYAQKAITEAIGYLGTADDY